MSFKGDLGGADERRKNSQGVAWNIHAIGLSYRLLCIPGLGI